MPGKHRRSMDGLPVEEREKWGRDKARAVASGYGPLEHRDGAEEPADLHAPQDLGDHGPWRSNAHDEPRYSNNVASDWRRGMGKGSGSPERGEKPNHDWGSFHEPPAVGKSRHYADSRAKPASYHAIDDNGRSGAGRPESRVTQYQPTDTKKFWAPERKGKDETWLK
jgi:hypothetical protein